MKKCLYIFALLFVIQTTPLSAQSSTTLTLTESIELAADSSLQAFRAKNMYQASYWEHRTFKAGRLPKLDLNMNPIEYGRAFVKRYDSDGYRSQKSLSSAANLSITQNFDPTGGQFFIDSQLGYVRNFGEKNITEYSAVPIRIGYSQPLFGFNKFKWEKKIEPLKYEKAKQQYLYNREEISETVILYFFNLAMAQADYNFAKDNTASTDTLYNIGQERHKIAAISQADLLTLKLDAVNARNALKNAEIDLKKAKDYFVSFLNLDKEINIELELPEVPRIIDVPVEDALEYARQNNPDYMDNQRQILEAEQEVDKTTKSSVFDASISASMGLNQVANKFSDAYRHLSQQEIIAISLTIPLIDWGVRKGRANMAKNNLNVTKISVQQKELSLDQEIRITVNDFNIQLDMIASAEEALELANLAYNATKQRFIIGKADINSLTLSLNRQKEAQKNHVSTLRNYWQNYYKLRKLTLFDFESRATLSYMFDKMY